MKLIDEFSAAGFLDLKPRTLSRWRWEGKGPPYCKVGGAIRYCMSDLECFVAQGRVGQ